MIYCVVPREFEAALYDRLVEYYADNPNVTVLIDRRQGHDRRRDKPAGEFEQRRLIRDRRRARAAGTFPDTDVPA